MMFRVNRWTCLRGSLALGIWCALFVSIEAQTQTWLYDLGADAWKRLPDADLAFKDGLNGMNMIFDSRHKVCLLVAFHSQGYHSVWVLKIDEAKLDGGK